MQEVYDYIVFPIAIVVIFFLVVRNKHVIAFKKRRYKLLNILKILALLFLFYRAVTTNKREDYGFAIFYGVLAMYDTYKGDKMREEEKEKSKLQ